MRIGQVGSLTGVDTPTIRYYESLGLIPDPPRTPSGYRDYGPDVVDRLRFIREAQASGLSLSEIGTILEMREAGERTCSHVISLLEEHLTHITAQIDAMRETQQFLSGILASARSKDPAACSDPNRCQIIEGTSKGAGAAASRVLHGAPHS
jgi:DNA-binding transcriptional MerR regulator